VSSTHKDNELLTFWSLRQVMQMVVLLRKTVKCGMQKPFRSPWLISEINLQEEKNVAVSNHYGQ